MKSKLFLFVFLSLYFYQSQAQIAPSPVGVQLYSFREQLKKDVGGSLQKVNELGITKVEAAGFYDLSASEFKKLTDANNLKIQGISVAFEDLEDDAKLAKVIVDAKTVGADYLVCFWIPHVEGDFTLEETQRAIKAFNKAGKTLTDNQLMFLYHPHGYEFRPYKNEYLIDLLIKETHPKQVSYEMDINWVYHAGHNPVTWLEKYPKRWKAMHVKDRTKGTACNQFGRMDVEKNVSLGDGEVNIEESVRTGIKIGIKYFFIEDESSRSFEQTPKSIEFLRRLF